MRYWADWSEAEIAEALGCRPGTVKTLASRGLERLPRGDPGMNDVEVQARLKDALTELAEATPLAKSGPTPVR